MNCGRVIFLSAACFGIAAIVCSILADPRPLLVYNASASVPIGFYLVIDQQPLHVGDYVLAMPPDSVRFLIAERNYLPPGVPLIKRVAATAGDHVCNRSGALVIDGIARVDEVLESDSLGRPLPIWSGCRTLRFGEIFLLNAGVPNSLDSRIFGSIPAGTITGKVVRLWTF